MRKLLIPAILAGLCSLLLYSISFAQANDYEETYIEEAIERVIQIETAYVVARDYLLNGRGTRSANKMEYDKLADLGEIIRNEVPPTILASTHQQIFFALQRCQNFSSTATWVTEEQLGSLFAETHLSQLREYCVVQINDAKLRLLDYASRYDINLFAELNAPIEVAGTTSITSTVIISESTDIRATEVATPSESISYVIVEDQTDTRLSPIVIEALRSDAGKLVIHVELEPSEGINGGGVTFKCYGARQRTLCGVSSALRMEPSGNLATYTEINANFDDVEWFEVYWQGRD